MQTVLSLWWQADGRPVRVGSLTQRANCHAHSDLAIERKSSEAPAPLPGAVCRKPLRGCNCTRWLNPGTSSQAASHCTQPGHLIHAASCRTCGIFAVADLLRTMPPDDHRRCTAPRHLVADAPHLTTHWRCCGGCRAYVDHHLFHCPIH